MSQSDVNNLFLEDLDKWWTTEELSKKLDQDIASIRRYIKGMKKWGEIDEKFIYFRSKNGNKRKTRAIRYKRKYEL